MGDEQWRCVRLRGTDMQEMNVLSINSGEKLWIRIELCFPDPPVICFLPVRNQPLKWGEGHAIGIINARQFICPANASQACFEIVYLGLRNSDGIGSSHRQFLLS